MDKAPLYNFFQGNSTPEEGADIQKWTEESPENYRILLKERQLFDAMILLANEKRLNNRPKQAISHRKWLVELGKIAAVIVITLAISLIYRTYPEKQEMFAMQQITVPAGQRISIRLSDGTDIWLNSRSTLRYSPEFAGDTRKVILSGEAYFEVAHNVQKPFVVETTKGTVKATGTRFNVEAYPDDSVFTASLMEGAIQVKQGNKRFVLKPGQMVYRVNGQLQIAAITDYNVYKWREGLICFKDAPFAVIMEKFEKYYGVRLVIENRKVLGNRYTGKFRQSDGIMYALKVLQKDVPFQFGRNDKNSIIYIQ